jgi:hypothetical protein
MNLEKLVAVEADFVGRRTASDLEFNGVADWQRFGFLPSWGLGRQWPHPRQQHYGQ